MVLSDNGNLFNDGSLQYVFDRHATVFTKLHVSFADQRLLYHLLNGAVLLLVLNQVLLSE